MLQLTQAQLDSLKEAIDAAWSTKFACSEIVKLPDGKGNEYQDLREFQREHGKHGVYRFVDRADKVLYVGSAPKQTLVRRLSQHLLLSNTGGTFRFNLKEMMPLDSEEQALQYIRQHTFIQLASTPSDEAELFERVAIKLYGPPYNKEKPRKKRKRKSG